MSEFWGLQFTPNKPPKVLGAVIHMVRSKVPVTERLMPPHNKAHPVSLDSSGEALQVEFQNFRFGNSAVENQLRLVVGSLSPYVYRVFYTSNRWLGMGFLNHQQSICCDGHEHMNGFFIRRRSMRRMIWTVMVIMMRSRVVRRRVMITIIKNHYQVLTIIIALGVIINMYIYIYIL